MDDYPPILNELELLIKQLSSSMSAVALIDRNNRIRWQYMHGNLNDRYLHMVTKPGVGLTGQVFRFGRTIIVDQYHVNSEHIQGRLPIMLSEQLLAAIAVPIFHMNRIFGVLLIGDREERTYTDEEIQRVELASQRILTLVPEGHIHIRS